MSTDELFLENIDELVNDENKVVTYKSLSYCLKVHCNVAKQMLYAFLTQERDKKGNDAVTATYFISGLTTPDKHGAQVFKCVVTNEEKLQKWKKCFSVLTSCHLYSIQKSKLKDDNPLYMSDLERFKENTFDCNRYSSIQYEKAQPRSEEDMDLLMVNIPVKEPEKKPSTSTTEINKAQTKKDQKSAIANMFAKVDNSKKPATKKEKVVNKQEEKTDTKKINTTKGGKKAGGMAGFLSKKSDAKATLADTKEKTPEKKALPLKVKKDPSPVLSKKSQRPEDSDDEDIFRSKKRRRTGQDIFESSEDEEEEMEAEPESPIPAKEKSEEPEVIEDEEEPKQPSPVKDKSKSVKPGESGQKKRVRKRKHVSKTSVDKDGFMVTEKVWESDSTDASEVEEPVKTPAPKAPTPEKGKKGSPKKKPSPSKKASGKQTSLMSFFKKS